MSSATIWHYYIFYTDAIMCKQHFTVAAGWAGANLLTIDTFRSDKSDNGLLLGVERRKNEVLPHKSVFILFSCVYFLVEYWVILPLWCSNSYLNETIWEL